MNNIQTSSGPGFSLLPEPIQTTYHAAVDWLNRSVQVISTIPSRLQNNPQQAMAVFFTANVIFLFFINLVANWADERVKNAPKVFTSGDIRLNQFFVNIVVVGGLAVISNIVLSILLSYPLKPLVLVSLAAGHIAFRIALNAFFPDN